MRQSPKEYSFRFLKNHSVNQPPRVFLKTRHAYRGSVVTNRSFSYKQPHHPVELLIGFGGTKS